MSTIVDPLVAAGARSTLPGSVVVARIRRLLIVSLATGLLYPAFMSASTATCAGGVDGDGGFIDSAGRSIDSAPACIQLTLGPSPLIYVAISLIVLMALGRVIRADREATALQILDRAVIGIVVLVVVAILVSQVWFRLIPIQDFMSGSFSFFSPFPFGTIESSTPSFNAP